MIVVRERRAHSIRPRRPEPMVMDEVDGVAEYDQAGERVLVPLHHVNALALSHMLRENGTLLDLGCGSGRLLARLARGRPDLHCIGLDLSEPMLNVGRQLLARESVVGRVELRRADITNPHDQLPPGLDLVSCNLALHQLPDTTLAQRCLDSIRRTREQTGCGVYIFDLVRMRDPRTWPATLTLVKLPGPRFLHDGVASERAAFTFNETVGLLEQAGLGDLQHAVIGPFQVHWAVGRRTTPRGHWNEAPLPRGPRLVTRSVVRAFPRALIRTS
jgi:SAM-dependent methyltransferase